MSKEAEEYLRKSNNRPTITFVNGLIGEPSFTISKTLELMQSYHESQIKDILIEFVESYNNNDE